MTWSLHCSENLFKQDDIIAMLMAKEVSDEDANNRYILKYKKKKNLEIKQFKIKLKQKIKDYVLVKINKLGFP